MRLVAAAGDRTAPVVMTCSARDGGGIAELWEHIARRFTERAAGGEVRELRRLQNVAVMWSAARTAVLGPSTPIRTCRRWPPRSPRRWAVGR
jgi:putative protein kinase ArgK-like GTPase of G3E family